MRAATENLSGSNTRELLSNIGKQPATRRRRTSKTRPPISAVLVLLEISRFRLFGEPKKYLTFLSGVRYLLLIKADVAHRARTCPKILKARPYTAQMVMAYLQSLKKLSTAQIIFNNFRAVSRLRVIHEAQGGEKLSLRCILSMLRLQFKKIVVNHVEYNIG